MRQHSALILEPETDSRGVQRAAFNVHTVVHIWNIITGYHPYYGNAVNLGHPYLESTYDTQAIKKQEIF